MRADISDVVGEVIEATGFALVGTPDGNVGGLAKLHCSCELVPQYSFYGFDVMLERIDGRLLPWVLEASHVPDVSAQFASKHASAALEALRAALESDNGGRDVQWDRGALEQCRALGCIDELELARCIRNIRDLYRERTYLAKLYAPHEPKSDARAPLSSFRHFEAFVDRMGSSSHPSET